MKKIKDLSIRPYARLLTMLGEQLIKNERIALVELIKNAYDADANWVKIQFLNFGTDLSLLPDSKILIEDDGEGMSLDVIENCWMNPATPNKLQTDITKKITKGKKRVIQGEKGIGRFAILKLGRKIKIYTRPVRSSEEFFIDYDLSKYDDEFLTESGKKKELFVDQIPITIYKQEPQYIVDKNIKINREKVRRKTHGTIIEISNLKGKWNENKLKKVYNDVSKLESIFTKIKDYKVGDLKINNFEICIEIENKPYWFADNYIEKLSILFENSSVLRIENGIFNNKSYTFEYTLNNKQKKIKLNDPNIKGLRVFKEYFGKKGEELKKRKVNCGSFRFSFYIFDFSAKAIGRYKLNKDDKDLIKDHRIYLYRDGIRVYPYGEPDDDWLQIDVYRGTISAGDFLSNDQVVGWIDVSQENNPFLKDKTNREGLLETIETYDFIEIIKIFLAYLRQHPYAHYRKSLNDKGIQDIIKNEQVQKDIDVLKEHYKDDKKGSKLINDVEKGYKAEKKFLVQRAETTEDLAGVGLSVETASHDIMSFMNKSLQLLDDLIQDVIHNNYNSKLLENKLEQLKGMISFIQSQLKDIQLLFKSAKQRRRNIRISEMLDKVIRIYKGSLEEEKIELIVNTDGSPLVAKTTEAVLLQVFLNLFDNAIYWLQTVDKNDKEIQINMNGNTGLLIFSDNGPGIHKDDAPYIFDSFFSGKGEEGRGLGLYIARQLLERQEYSIELAELKKDKLLSGANFIINFISMEE